MCLKDADGRVNIVDTDQTGTSGAILSDSALYLLADLPQYLEFLQYSESEDLEFPVQPYSHVKDFSVHLLIP